MQSLDDSIRAFLNHCELDRNFSPHTVKAYRLDLGQFARFNAKLEDGDFSHLIRSDIREFTRTLSCYEPRTQRRKLATLKSFFGFLEREGIMPLNPTRHVRLDIRVGRVLPRTITLPVLQAFFQQLYAHRSSEARHQRSEALAIRDIALFELMFCSGMRVSEISNLRLATVDLEKGAVLVRGKGNKERLIPLCDLNVRAALAAYARLNGCGNADRYFFTNRYGRRLSEQSIRIALRRHSEAARIGKITPHVFRHTVATMLLEQGVDLRFIQALLGHSSIVTTTIYAHVNDRSQRNILSQHHPRRLVAISNGQNPSKDNRRLSNDRTRRSLCRRSAHVLSPAASPTG